MSVQNFNLDIDDYAIAAGGYLELGKPADFFQIMEATGQVDITFLHSESAVGKAKGVGQGFRLGPIADRFYGVKIYSATAQTLKLCFSSGKSPVDLSQVVSVTGTVSVVNGEYARSLSGVAFSAGGGISASAGQYPCVQLLNPTGTGKRVVITQAVVSPTVDMGVSLRIYATALTTLSAAPASKYLEIGPASVAQFRLESMAALPGSVISEIYSTAYDSKLVDLREPFILEPGKGLVLSGLNVASTLSGAFQFYEEAI